VKFLGCGAAVTIAGVLTLSAAGAQDFPTRPIKIVIAFPAGGPTDFVGRIVGEKIRDELGQSVIIENKAGASGTLGADYVAKSEPDGYTLFLTTVGAVAITPNMRSNLPYDPIADFAPITQVVRNTTVLATRSDSPIATAQELAALAKAKPDTITFASTGYGTTTHLALELFQSAAGVKFLHVPYKGAAPAVTDILGGQVQAMFADLPVLMSQIEAGKLKPLAAASDRRNPMLPQVATLAELGYPDTQSDNWYGLLAPVRTPRAIVMKLNEAMTRALADPEVNRKLLASGAIPAPTSPEQFGTLLKDELARWGKVVREKGIKDS
jgi:tripartite-type tricarboxylate transporter receptor subunit TctC